MTPFDDRISITILVDNHCDTDLLAEHGFAALVQVAGRTILFDTGQGAALLPNAAALGVDLRNVEILVLSHGHYDHGGAIDPVLALAPDCRIVAHRDALTTRFSVKPGNPPRDIAVGETARRALNNLPEGRLQWIDKPLQLFPGVFLTGQIPRQHQLEDTGGPFFLDPAGHESDPLDDDLALWIETDRGLVILTGCCHAGLLNTVNHIRSCSGYEKIRAIIGGLHLVNASPKRLLSTWDALRLWQPESVIPCHCTGEHAVAFLCDAMGETVQPGFAGLRLSDLRLRPDHAHRFVPSLSPCTTENRQQ